MSIETIIIILILGSVANYRITKLITYDVISEPIRNKFRHIVTIDGEDYYVPNNSFFAKLIFCNRCVAIWIGIFEVVALEFLPIKLLLWISLVCFMASVSDILFKKLEDE